MPLRPSNSLRTFFSSRKLSVLFLAASLGAIAPSASAASTRKSGAHKHPRIHALEHAFVNVALPGAGLLPDDEEDLPEEGEKYQLRLVRAHTNEVVDVVYRIGDTYIPEALDKLNTFLRDSHNQEVSAYDPREFDLLHTMLAKVNKPGSVIDILSGYRSQQTNDALRASGTSNAAEHSQHIEAKAIDLRVEGVPAATLRDAALELGAGGVGYYPKSQFVHIDVGPVRKWTYASHKGRGHRRGRRSRRS